MEPDLVDAAGLRVLDRTACLRRLSTGGIGRVAVNRSALPLILPVHFQLDHGEVVMCVGEGSTLARATCGAVVAFEADGADDEGTWSVSLVGIARHVDEGAEIDRVASLELPLWWSGRPHRFVVLPTDRMEGRCFATGHRHAPDRHSTADGGVGDVEGATEAPGTVGEVHEPVATVLSGRCRQAHPVVDHS
jgi:hypothetical protein